MTMFEGFIVQINKYFYGNLVDSGDDIIIISVTQLTFVYYGSHYSLLNLHQIYCIKLFLYPSDGANISHNVDVNVDVNADGKVTYYYYNYNLDITISYTFKPPNNALLYLTGWEYG